MKRVAFLSLLAIALSVGGCALLSQGQLEAAKSGFDYTFTVYHTGYQPLLKIYGEDCAKPAPLFCKKELYRKLYEADGAVVECAAAAQKTLASNFPDFGAVSNCVRKVEDAKLAIAGTGVKAP